jgi:hypothetical protein
MLIICNTQNHHIYTRTERKGKGLAAGETDRERERECVRCRVAENRVRVHCKNGRWRVTDHFGIILGSKETILMEGKDYKDTLRL